MKHNIDVDYKGRQGDIKMYITPLAPLAKHLAFTPESESEASINEAKNEAHLADAIARVAEQNGMGINDVHQVLPFILRMLKSKTAWAK